jgi:hypothetical protein
MKGKQRSAKITPALANHNTTKLQPWTKNTNGYRIAHTTLPSALM